MQEAMDYVDENLESFIEYLKILCSVPSISAKNEGIEENAALILEIMGDAGLNSKILRIKGANPLVYGEYKPESYDKTIIFFNPITTLLKQFKCTGY
jgi:hypothetical protein